MKNKMVFILYLIIRTGFAYSIYFDYAISSQYNMILYRYEQQWYVHGLLRYVMASLCHLPYCSICGVRFTMHDDIPTPCMLIYLASLAPVRGALSSKLRGPEFKSRPGTVGGPVTILMWGAWSGWKLALS